MNAFLLTWNPKKFHWNESAIRQHAKASRAGKTVTNQWSCANSRKPATGDRAYLIKLGSKARGIFAAGTIVRGAFHSPGSSFGPMALDVEWDTFLDPLEDRNLLDPTSIGRSQMWAPQNSGTQINAAAWRELERRWATHLARQKVSPAPATVTVEDARDSDELVGLEGAVRKQVIAHRRRERSLREAKLSEHQRIHGDLRCEVCSYDFGTEFGVRYAEVHHLKPLGLATRPQLTRLRDLAVLCANCHRVAHLDRSRPKSLRQLRQLRSKRS
ncbi:MAG: HNH endonuclease [Myxococcales bacterium]|nr:HNH endonuclease [Myxococcales bacterium]